MTYGLAFGQSYTGTDIRNMVEREMANGATFIQAAGRVSKATQVAIGQVIGASR